MNDKQWSSATPGLLIILLDQSGSMMENYEGTTRTKFATLAVNKVIDNIISKNADGTAPKNRCFISVIGYNHNVKELCSGWLKDLDVKPLRYETVKKKMHDGAGGIIEREVNTPVWVESAEQQISIDIIDRAIHFAKELSLKWSEDNCMSPIVIDCSKVCHTEYAKEIIGQLKAITTMDGNVLFFGCYSKKENGSEIFSKMPEEWEYKFQRRDLKKEDYINGLLNYEHIGPIFCAIMEV